MILTRDLRACCNPKRLLTGLLFSSLLFFGVAATAQEGNHDYYTAQSTKGTIDLLTAVEKYHLPGAYDGLAGKHYYYAFGEVKFILHYFPNHPKALMLMSAICNGWQSPDCNPDEWFEKAVSRNPAVSETYVLYGIDLHRRKRFDAAVKNYKQALEIDPISLNAHYNLGLAYVDLKQYELANQQAQKSYALGAPFPGLRERLKRVGAWKPLDAEAVPNNQGQSPAQK
jgi:tetratricopeptide (TPR) repeat protein